MSNANNDKEADTVADLVWSKDTNLDEFVGNLRKQYQSREPKVQAFVKEDERWTRIRNTIEGLLADYPDPDERPPLFGTPVGVKDIIHVDGIPTKAGSQVPPTELAGPQADCITALKSAGAFVFGKTVTTEFAFADPGPTRNPHNYDHTPGGSSSGSAAAVAAGMCPIALGTQTGGSVIRPAAFCGIIGVKPTYGRVPIDGVLPYSLSLDHVGVFTQKISHARMAVQLLFDRWKDRSSNRRPRIGVPAEIYLEHAEDKAKKAYSQQISKLSDAGFEVVKTDILTDLSDIMDFHRELKAAECALSHHERFKKYAYRYSTILSEQIKEGRNISVGSLAEAREHQTNTREQLEEGMTEAEVDIIASPAAPGPAPSGIDDTGNPIMNVPWTYAGLPTATIPTGTIDGLPIGLQCTTRFNKDEVLFTWLEHIESVLRPNDINFPRTE